MTTNRLVLFEKDGNTGSMGVIFLEDKVVTTSWDSRDGVINVQTKEYGGIETKSFDSQVELTQERGWKILFNGTSPIGDNANLN